MLMLISSEHEDQIKKTTKVEDVATKEIKMTTTNKMKRKNV
jgi:hypothetical protein